MIVVSYLVCHFAKRLRFGHLKWLFIGQNDKVSLNDRTIFVFLFINPKMKIKNEHSFGDWGHYPNDTELCFLFSNLLGGGNRWFLSSHNPKWCHISCILWEFSVWLIQTYSHRDQFHHVCLLPNRKFKMKLLLCWLAELMVNFGK